MMINSRKARQRPTGNQGLMSRFAIKYAVSIYQLLPNITGSVAQPAKPIGDFGLVGGGLPTVTKHYHRPDLSISPGLPPLPSPPPPTWGLSYNT